MLSRIGSTEHVLNGNGIIARLAMNTALIQNSYLPVVIPPVLRHEYIESLRLREENMGLDWMGQFKKLKSNEKRWGIEIISMPSESGAQRTLCMSVRKLPAFLASFNPTRLNPSFGRRSSFIRLSATTRSGITGPRAKLSGQWQSSPR